MIRVGIVSCDKWQEKIQEDLNLRTALIDLGITAEIISWQKPLLYDYDLLVLRSVWGYQNDYKNFKEWLLRVKKSGVPLYNSPDIILPNILKNQQFEILKRNGIDYVETYFVEGNNFNSKTISHILNGSLASLPSVIKPTISGSGENTFLLNYVDEENTIPNMIFQDDIESKYQRILDSNDECGIMLQPYISQINEGEYSCIFLDGELTHTMLRFPNIFHETKRPYLVNNPPREILQTALNVEKITDFKGYLYMRVDMVLVDGNAKVMEVELTEPDLLTKYIEDEKKQDEVIKTFAQKIERRVR